MFKSLETERLVLRKFNEDDFAAVHGYASCIENVLFMGWGPNSEEDTREFIQMAITSADKQPCEKNYFAVVLKGSGQLIGGCDISIEGTCGHIGWIIHRDYWRQGYCTELATELLRFGFKELNVRRIITSCDAENVGSYRVMEKIGMRREGLFIEAAPAHKQSKKMYGDELFYAMLKGEWER